MPRAPQRGEPTAPWCTDWAGYRVGVRAPGHPLVVGARCRLAGTALTTEALVDTGAEWSVVGGEMVKLVEPQASRMGQTIHYSTRLGVLQGDFYRMGVELVADHGQNLHVDATVLLMPEWRGPAVVLGYRGLLERVRFALEPGVRDDDQWWCFGGYHVAGTSAQTEADEATSRYDRDPTV
jgi:hypothetical protein